MPTEKRLPEVVAGEVAQCPATSLHRLENRAMDTQIASKARPKSRASRDIVIAYAKGAETA